MKTLKYLFVFTLLFSVFACKSQQSNTENKTEAVKESVTATQKNILFIAVDDLKPLLSNYGHKEMHTPNFDRLAAMGVSFTNAHVQYAVCGPSRASVMTGTNPDRTKVWDLHTDFRKSAPNLVSMPEYLISLGYETTAVGKIYHKGSTSPGHDAKSWSIPYISPTNFDSNYGDPAFNYYQNPETKAKMAKLTEEAIAKGRKPNKTRGYVFKRLKPSTESADVSDEAYQDGLYTQVALQQIDKLSEGDKPFFIAVGYQKPHLPFIAPKKYWDLYNRSEIELAKFQELAEGTPKLAYHSFGELRAYSDIDNKLKIGDKLPEAKQRELIHGYMASISYIDAQIGKLLDRLEQKNILDNTVIVLWGDHGWHLGDHTLWCKHSNLEQATRIPFMFADAGIAKNKRVDNPVNLVDLFPTVFELAGVKQSTQTDGKSLVPLLDTDASTTINMDYSVSQYGRAKNKSTMGYSLRTERYRYTEWHKNNYRSNKEYKDENIVGRELYDYEKDPLETKNLVDNSAYIDIAKQLKSKLKNHLQNEKETF